MTCNTITLKWKCEILNYHIKPVIYMTNFQIYGELFHLRLLFFSLLEDLLSWFLDNNYLNQTENGKSIFTNNCIFSLKIFTILLFITGFWWGLGGRKTQWACRGWSLKLEADERWVCTVGKNCGVDKTNTGSVLTLR